jgi:hypothetical protein
MASRPHTTQKKRQRELARLEKQRDKAAKRLQRKLERRPLGDGTELEAEPGAAADTDAGAEPGAPADTVAGAEPGAAPGRET